MVGAGRGRSVAGAASSAPAGHADRRPLRRARRKSRRARRSGRRSSRRSIARPSGSSCSPPISSACAFTPRSWSPTRSPSKPRRSTPCSWTRPAAATGTIRRHPDVAWIKRPGDLAPLVKLQAELIDKAIALARPGGAIVYCVCSLEPEEGEAQIAAVLRRNPDVRRLPCRRRRSAASPNASPLRATCGRCPHLWGENPRRSGLDGFFAARLVKEG